MAGRPGATDSALPVDMTAAHGRGVQRGLSLGGRGLVLVAWQVASLPRLAVDGVDVALLRSFSA